MERKTDIPASIAARFGARKNQKNGRIYAKRTKRLLQAMGEYTPPPLHVQPLDFMTPHQVAGCEIASQYNRYGFYWGMRTGKTLVGLTIADSVGKIDGKTLVVCPTHVVQVWIDENEKHFGGSIRVADIRKDKTVDPSEYDVFVVNYQNVWKPYVQQYADACQCIIADESQALKDPQTKQSKAVFSYSENCDYVYLFSGTPAPNGYHEYYLQLKILSESYSEYPAFTRWKFENFDIDFFGNPKLPKLDAKNFIDIELKKYAQSVRFKDVAIPQQETDIFRYFELTKKEQTAYEKLKKDIVETVSGDQPIQHAVTKAGKFRQIVSGLLYDDENIVNLGESKIKTLKSVIAEIGDENAIIWHEFRHEREQISKVLESIGKRYSVAAGNSTVGALEEFKSGRSQFLVAHPASIGHGQDLKDNCDISIYYSLNFSHELHSQSRARVLGVAKNNPLTYIYLLAEGGLFDTRVYNVLKNKQKIEEAVMAEIGEGSKNE